MAADRLLDSIGRSVRPYAFARGLGVVPDYGGHGIGEARAQAAGKRVLDVSGKHATSEPASSRWVCMYEFKLTEQFRKLELLAVLVGGAPCTVGATQGMNGGSGGYCLM